MLNLGLLNLNVKVGFADVVRHIPTQSVQEKANES